MSAVAERHEIDGALAAASGEGLEVWNGRDGAVSRPPAGGVLLHVEWSERAHSTITWYPTLASGRAALSRLARHEGRVVGHDAVDLTASGCHPSRAYLCEVTP